MDGFDQSGGMVRVGKLRNAVPEVKHMAAAGAVGSQDAGGFGFDGGRVGKQRGGVKIALQGDLIANAATGFADVGGPIKTYRITANRGDFF